MSHRDGEFVGDHSFVLHQLSRIRRLHKSSPLFAEDGQVDVDVVSLRPHMLQEAALFKEILPAYTIKDRSGASARSKSTKALDSLEEDTLTLYRKFLNVALSLARSPNAKNGDLGCDALVALLPAAADTNFSSAVLDGVVRGAIRKGPSALGCVGMIKQLLAHDSGGDITVKIVCTILTIVKSLGASTPVRLIACLLSVRLAAVDERAAAAAESSQKATKNKGAVSSRKRSRNARAAEAGARGKGKATAQADQMDRTIARELGKADAFVRDDVAAKTRALIISRVLTCFLRLLEAASEADGLADNAAVASQKSLQLGTYDSRGVGGRWSADSGVGANNTVCPYVDSLGGVLAGAAPAGIVLTAASGGEVAEREDGRRRAELLAVVLEGIGTFGHAFDHQHVMLLLAAIRALIDHPSMPVPVQAAAVAAGASLLGRAGALDSAQAVKLLAAAQNTDASLTADSVAVDPTLLINGLYKLPRWALMPTVTADMFVVSGGTAAYPLAPRLRAGALVRALEAGLLKAPYHPPARSAAAVLRACLSSAVHASPYAALAIASLATQLAVSNPAAAAVAGTRDVAVAEAEAGTAPRSAAAVAENPHDVIMADHLADMTVRGAWEWALLARSYHPALSVAACCPASWGTRGPEIVYRGGASLIPGPDRHVSQYRYGSAMPPTYDGAVNTAASTLLERFDSSLGGFNPMPLPPDNAVAVLYKQRTQPVPFQCPDHEIAAMLEQAMDHNTYAAFMPPRKGRNAKKRQRME